MSDIQDYYRQYHQNGGVYKLEDYRMSSRYLMITRWLKDNAAAGGNVTDIGAGDCTYSKDLPQFNWINLDINTEKGANIAWDLEETPYPIENQSQDAVVCSEVLEHLFSPEKVHAEAHRMLKPGGHYIISTPNFDWIEHHLGFYRQVVYDPEASHAKEHIRFYTFETHIKMLDQAGFEVLDHMGADIQFGSVLRDAALELAKEMPEKTLGEVHYVVGKMFRRWAHTIGILAVKK